MLDIIDLIFTKMVAAAAVCVVLGLPALLAWVIGYLPTDEHDGFDFFYDHLWARWLYRGFMGVFVGTGYIVFFNYAIDNTLTKPLRVLVRSVEEHKSVQEQSRPPVRSDVGTELRRFELVSWNPPKHFYVTIKDVETGKLYEGLYVSKHCNTSDLKHGQQYNLHVRYYTLSSKPGQRFMEFMNLSGAFC